MLVPIPSLENRVGKTTHSWVPRGTHEWVTEATHAWVASVTYEWGLFSYSRSALWEAMISSRV